MDLIYLFMFIIYKNYWFLFDSKLFLLPCIPNNKNNTTLLRKLCVLNYEMKHTYLYIMSPINIRASAFLAYS